MNCCVQACKQTQRDKQGRKRAKCAHVVDTNNNNNETLINNDTINKNQPDVVWGHLPLVVARRVITTSSNDSGTETCWRTLRSVRCDTVLHATPSTHLASWRTQDKLQKSAHTAPHTHATRSLFSKVCCSLQKPTHRFTLESLMNFTEHKNFEIHRSVLMSCNATTSPMCPIFWHTMWVFVPGWMTAKPRQACGHGMLF